MKKLVFLVLAFVLTASSGFSWPWDSKEKVAKESANPFVGKAFITALDNSSFTCYLFNTDTGLSKERRTIKWLEQGFDANISGKYDFDPKKSIFRIDFAGYVSEYTYSFEGKVLRLSTLSRTIELYEVPLPPFWIDENGPYLRAHRALEKANAEYHASSENRTEEKCAALKSLRDETYSRCFAIVEDLIAQAKGAPPSKTTPTPTPIPTPTVPPPPPPPPPTPPPPTPIQISLPIQPITIIQANGNAGPSHQIVPLDGEYRGKMANVAANFEREMVMKIKSAGAPQGTSPTLRVNAHIEVKKPDGLEEGDFSGFAIYGETTTITLELDYEAGRGRIDAYAMGNFLVGQWQFFPKNNNKPSFGFLVLEKKK